VPASLGAFGYGQIRFQGLQIDSRQSLVSASHRGDQRGSVEESILISQVASVSIQAGLIWSTIQIDSSGGSDPIVSRGHWRKDSRRIGDLIERLR